MRKLQGYYSPTTAENDYTPQQLEFMKAMDLYKRKNHRPFPTFSEALAVLESLGYRKVEKPGPLPKFYRSNNQELFDNES